MTNEDCLRVLSPPFAARFQSLVSPGAARDSWRLLGEGRRANMGPVPPTLPLGFSACLADARQGLVGRAPCGLFAHQKQLCLPPSVALPAQGGSL